ncbi:MAG: hypothetical protein GXP18_10930 [Gammaproteobacteria bacterium]|nr:hypothetical protein [Gammaproteobacteria bacterium]
MSIKLEIAQWDGKSTNDIGEIYHRHCHDSSLTTVIITLVADEALQKGATWLLKRYLENENRLMDTEIAKIYDHLSILTQWESRLHILQCFPFMPILKSRKKKVESFLRDCLLDNNKFVRAWAYNGFYELAVQYPEYKKEACQFFEMAMRDEAPSVKSRIRNILKKGF